MADDHRRSVDDETRSRAVDFMVEGKLTRNGIARELGIAASTVSLIAREVGHEFDRSKTEIAVRARQIDMAEARALLAKASLDEAFQALEEMHAPAKMVQFESGNPVEHFNEDGVLLRKEYTPGEFREHILDEPTFSDKRNLATIYGIMITKANELTRSVDQAGSAESLSYIDGMSASLDVLRKHLAPTPESDPTVEPTNASREAMLAEFEDDSPATP